jgi:hypothetical protein
MGMPFPENVSFLFIKKLTPPKLKIISSLFFVRYT